MDLKRAWIVAGGVALAVCVAVAEPAPAAAGGAIGWADAVTQISAEGQAVGAVAVVLGILAVGAILMFGITGIVTTVVMLALGGALMANSDTVAQTLFTGGAGGGSIYDVRLPPPGPHA